MSYTTRTDALIERKGAVFGPAYFNEFVDHARQLERELHDALRHIGLLNHLLNGSSGVSRPDVSGSSERGDKSQPEREKADGLKAPATNAAPQVPASEEERQASSPAVAAPEWRNARNVALEEAAKECEDPANWTHKITFSEIAAAIRRKKSP